MVLQFLSLLLDLGLLLFDEVLLLLDLLTLLLVVFQLHLGLFLELLGLLFEVGVGLVTLLQFFLLFCHYALLLLQLLGQELHLVTLQGHFVLLGLQFFLEVFVQLLLLFLDQLLDLLF